jgi:transcription termination/antitermination protein NusA
MSKKEMLLLVVDALARQKGLEKEEVFTFLEQALATILLRREEGVDLAVDEEQAPVTAQVEINRETGDLARVWQVVSTKEEVQDPCIQRVVAEVREFDQGAQSGQKSLEPLHAEEVFGRIDANQAKHIILRSVREAERTKKAEHYRQNALGTLVTGQVKKIASAGILIELPDGVDALVPRGQGIPRENIHVGDYLKGYLFEIDELAKGPFLLISRAMPDVLSKLLALEIPEIAEGSIEVKAVARDPGVRAKVIVKTHDRRIDPIGACVGVRGSRVQTISSELSGERVDIILWDEDPVKLVRNAVVPAQVVKVEVDDYAAKQMTLVVDDDNLAMVIGRHGQNIRLASAATGWHLNVISVADQAAKSTPAGDSAQERVVKSFQEALDIDHDVALALFRGGFTRVDQIASAELAALQKVESFNQELASALSDRAKAALLSDILLVDEQDVVQPEADLLALKSVSEPLAFLLAKHGVVTRELLAEQSVDELLDVVADLSSKEAAVIIMEAREPWFQKDTRS